MFFASSILSFFSGDTVAEGAAEDGLLIELIKSALEMEGMLEDDELARRGMGGTAKCYINAVSQLNGLIDI